LLHSSDTLQDEDWGFSPHGKYLSAFSLSSQVPIVQVFDATTGDPVSLGGSTTQSGFTNIGFSADDDSLLAWSAQSTKLFNLVTGSAVWQHNGPPAAYGFSPLGGYLEVKTVTNTTHVELEIIELSNGASVYQDSYDFQTVPYVGADSTPPASPSPASSPSPTSSFFPTTSPMPTQDPVPSNSSFFPTTSPMPTQDPVPSNSSFFPTTSPMPTQNPVPGSSSPAPSSSTSQPSKPTKGKGKTDGPSFQSEATGFSPDGHTFLLAYVNGPATATLTVVNLRDQSTILDDEIADRAGSWAFSPCGGTFGRMSPTDTDQAVALYSTADGRELGSTHVPAAAPVTLTADEDNDVASYTDGTGQKQTVTLAPNLWCAVATVSYYKTVYGGATTTWSLTLDRPAHDYGITLGLSSSSSYLSVPASVTVPAGQKVVSFDVASTPTSHDVNATVTFSYESVLGGAPQNTAFAVTVMTVPVQTVSLDQSEVTGAATVNGTVELVQPAPAGGVIVDLSSDNSALAVPAQVTVPAGATSADFLATAEAVAIPATATVSATSGATTVTATVDLQPLLATTTSIAVSPAGGVAVAGETVALTARITPVVAAGAVDNGYPTGTVTFTDGATTLATVDVDPVSASSADEVDASFSASDFAGGDHHITATYSGDDYYLSSSSTTTVTVGAGLTWTGGGGDGNWSNPANWDANRAPVTDDVLVIKASAALTVTDDIPGLAVRGLHLNGPVTVNGRPLTLDGDIDAYGDSATVNNDLVLAAGAHPLATDHELYLPGTISGAGDISVTTTSSSFVVLDGAAANSYTGATEVTNGSSLFVAQDGALGSAASGTTVAGTLCIADGVSVAEPVVSHGGSVAACDTVDGLIADLNGDDYDPYAYSADPTATLTGTLDDEGGVSFGPYSCYDVSERSFGPFSYFGSAVALDIAGAVTGPGSVEIGCAAPGDTNATDGVVRFTGDDANSYTGGTAVTGTLTLSKPDDVVALPGDATGRGEIALGGDDQIAHSATVQLSTLDLGGHQATVAALDTALHANVKGDGTSGQVHVTGDVTVRSIAVGVAADPAVGSVMTVVDNRSASAIADCPNTSVIGGSSATSFRVDCTAGDGNDLAVTTVWRSTATLTTDPADGVATGSPVTLTVVVSAPPGGAAPTGQVVLKQYWFRSDWNQWQYRQSLATADLVDGTATFHLDDTSVFGLGNGLVASYVGDSLHAPVDSPITRYVTWGSPAASLPGVPTNLSVGVSGPGENNPDSAFVQWGYPAGSSRTDFISYHITVTPLGGQPYVIDTATMGDPNDLNYGDYPTFPFYRVTGLTPGQSYTFTVQAVNSAGVGPATDPVTVSVPSTPPAGKPGAPVNLVAIAGPGQAQLTWSAPADDGGAPITSYDVTPYINGVAQDDIWTADATTSLVVTGLTPGTAYTFRVAAANAAQVGYESAATKAVTPTSLPGGIVLPGTPTNVSAAPGGLGEITINWTAPADNGGSPIVGYAITPSDSYGAWGQYFTGDASTSVTMTGLPAGDQLTFTVAAVTAAGVGPDSGATSPVAPGDGSGGGTSALGAPTNVTATAGPAQVFLSWTAPSDDGGAAIQHYVVTPYVGGVAQAPISLTGTGTTATIGGLLPGVAYTFTVAAVNANGAGPESDQTAAATPSAPPPVTNTPTAPTNATVHGTGQNVTLTWSTPGSDGGSPVTGYQVIEWSAKSANFSPWSGVGGAYSFGASASWWVPAGTTSLDITTPTITSPWSQGAYWFTVAAANNIGFGPQSARSNGVDAVWIDPTGGYVGGPGIGLPPDPTAPPGGNGDISNGAGGAIDANGFDPNEPVNATMHSTPIDLGAFTAGADGSVHATFTVPADLPPGDHTIELIGANSGHDVVVPVTVVQQLTVSDVTSSSFTVDWPAATDGVTGFDVVVDGTVLASVPASATSYAVTGMAPGVAHVVEIRGNTAHGAAGKLAIDVLTTSTLDLTPTSGQVVLNWLASPDPTVTGYEVQRAGGDGVFAAVAGVSGADATSYVDSGLLASTMYKYQVRAVHADGAKTTWSDAAEATTPDLSIGAVTVTTTPALGGAEPSYGSTISVQVTGDPGRSVSATVAGHGADNAAVSTQVSLTETTPGNYAGSVAIEPAMAVVDTVTGTISDGVHSVQATASGLPVTQSGEISIDVATPNAPVQGAQLELVNASLGVDDLRTIDVPGHLDVPVNDGSWTVRLIGANGDVLAQQPDVAVSPATKIAVSLTPVVHASLTVNLLTPPGETSGGFTVTVSDSGGTVLGQADVTSGQTAATFDGLVAGAHVTITATVDDTSRALLSTIATTAQLVAGANTVDLAEQALPTGRLQGQVNADGTPIAVTVSETVDGRSWQFTTTSDAQGNYGLDALAGVAHVSLTATGYQPAAYDVTVAAGVTTTATTVTLQPVPHTQVATRLTVDQISSLRDLLDLLLGRYWVTAHLTRADTGAGIAGQRVVIDSWRGDFCAAVTNAKGIATCPAPPRLASVVLLGQVHASYAGSSDYLPSEFGDATRPGHGWW
jgi:titin